MSHRPRRGRGAAKGGLVGVCWSVVEAGPCLAFPLEQFAPLPALLGNSQSPCIAGTLPFLPLLPHPPAPSLSESKPRGRTLGNRRWRDLIRGEEGVSASQSGGWGLGLDLSFPLSCQGISGKSHEQSGPPFLVFISLKYLLIPPGVSNKITAMTNTSTTANNPTAPTGITTTIIRGGPPGCRALHKVASVCLLIESSQQPLR